MRLYEFSKKHGISSKDLLHTLKSAGFEVTSHMARLSEEAQQFLEKKLDTTSASISHQKKIEKKQVEKETASQGQIRKQKQVDTPQKKRVVTETKKSVTVEKEVIPSKKRDAILLKPTSLSELAPSLGEPINTVILTLLKWGILANKNQILSENIIARIATHYGVETQAPVKKKEKILKKESFIDQHVEARSPIVVVLGHVDHGKTTLLDHIRKTRVTAKEKGGITQHLGAYEAVTKHGNIIFIDTPGHEAFSKIRQRGARVADLAILIVAADDSVMPQTKEAIDFAKEAELPIVVAINKVDKVGIGQVETVKRDISQYDLLPEEWGGNTVCVPISATEGTGINHLLEMVAIQAELMELKAKKTGPAQGYILESKLEKGRGPVATVLLQQGQMKLNDYFVCDGTRGRVSSLVDSHGKKHTYIGPANPVQVAGFDALPEPGSSFNVVSKVMYRKGAYLQEDSASAPKYIPEDSINIIIKTDTLSSKEALTESIEKLTKKLSKSISREFNVVYAGIGDISESDIMLASDTGSKIIGLHVKLKPLELRLAQQIHVSITTFDIIYKLLEFLTEEAEKTKPVKMIRKKLGQAIVRRVFNIKKVGSIAGSYIQEGLFSRDGFIVAYRDGQKIGEGKIKSLQRDKKNVKEVHAGYECAFMVEGLHDWQPEDTVECFLEVSET